MRISSNTPSLQMLKAQQALEARRAKQAEAPKPEAPPSAPTQPNRATASAEVAALPQENAVMSSPWGQTVREIQNIAKKSGFIGVTEQDIRRAYTMGESLLADYRV